MKFQTAIPIFVIIVLISNFLNAKDKFAPAIQVDDMIITRYEIQQRSAFFELLKFPGNPKKEAERKRFFHDSDFFEKGIFKNNHFSF